MIEATTTNSSTTSLPPASAESSASPTTTVANTAGSSNTESATLMEVLSNPQGAGSASTPSKLQETLETVIKLLGRFLELVTTYLKSQGQGEVSTKPAPVPTKAPTSGQTPTNTSTPTSTQRQTSHGCSHTTTTTTTTTTSCNHPAQPTTGGATANLGNGTNSGSSGATSGNGATSGSGGATSGNGATSGSGGATSGNGATSGSGGTPSNPVTSNPANDPHHCCCPSPTDKTGETDNKDTPPTKLKNVGGELGASGEFLWKPKSDKNGKLAVLIPSSLTGKIDEVAIVSADKKRVLQKGKFAGVGNGDREHFRFAKSGDKFPDGSIVWIKLKDGTSRHIVIKETGARYTK